MSELEPNISWPEEEEKISPVGSSSPSGRSLVDDLSEDSSGEEDQGSESNTTSIPSLSTDQLSIMTTSAPTTTKIILDGEEIEVSPSVLTTSSTLTTLYLKTDREALKKDNKLNDLFEKATKESPSIIFIDEIGKQL